MWENEFVASILSRFSRDAEPEPTHPAFEPPPPGLGLTDVATMSLDTMSALINRFRLAAQPPDVLVEVPGDAARTLDFHRAHELIDLGRRLTVRALDHFEAGLIEADDPS